MNAITLKPQTKTMYTVQPERSHSRLSLRRVLYVKFLRWVDKAPTQTLVRVMSRCFASLAIFLIFLAPQLALGVIASLVSSKWLLGASLACGFFYYRTILRLSRKMVPRRKAASCFHGVPILELADYLLSEQAFPTKAVSHLRLSQPQHAKIAKSLEGHGILIRGDSNARIMRPITRTELVEQLEKNFPLQWSDHEKTWIKRRDSFATYLFNREQADKQAEEKVEKRQRKLSRIEKRIATLQSPFTVRELAYPV